MRTQQEISDQMDAVQAQFPELANLTSTSNTSVFGLIRNIWIAAQMALDHYIDGVLANLQATAASVRVGTLQWYVDQVKAFQFGDPLAIIDGRTGYDVIDPSKRIITQAACTEVDGRLTIKVAKPKDFFSLQPLADVELTALKEYVRQVKYAGVAVDVVSLPADELRLIAQVQYSRQTINSQGYLLDGSGRLPALEAVITYIRSLPFNATLNNSDLTAYVRAFHPGLVDFSIAQSYTRPAGSADWIEYVRETQSRPGHLTLISPEFTYV